MIPHTHNWRRHPDSQKAALRAIYDEVGFARSLLAFERPDGRLQLIDGHLRRDLTPDAVVPVEILDVTEEEARKLLLTMDPMAGLATADEQVLDELRRINEADHDVLNSLWEQLGAAAKRTEEELERRGIDEPTIPEQYLILINCQSESEQTELLERLCGEGLDCRPLTSFGG